MKKFYLYALITVGITIFTSCIKLIDSPEFYKSRNAGFNIIKVINDSMGFAVDDRFRIYSNEPECVLITNELLYDDKSIYGSFCGEWQLVGTWKGIIKTYPIIKFYKYDSLECIQHIKKEAYMDSLMRETLGEESYEVYKRYK